TCAPAWPAPRSGSRVAEYRTLSVVVPVYNERTTVVEILRRMRQVELPVDLEIVVVDDGSDDGTEKVLGALEDSTVRVIHHPRNRGKGAAIRTGLEHARGDLLLIQDADLEYDPDDWPRLLGPVLKGRAQVVYGSRFTGERRNLLFWHWVGNRFLSLVTNVLYNTTLSDMETCSKQIDRQVLDGVVDIVVADNASTDGSDRAVAASDPSVVVLPTGANLGFGGAANRGVAACPGDYVLLLNPDTLVEPGTVKVLAAALDRDPGLA